jgi:hypothetical protein
MKIGIPFIALAEELYQLPYKQFVAYKILSGIMPTCHSFDIYIIVGIRGYPWL